MMNERIKQLMKQAGTDSSGKWMGVEHAEKFAELIAYECMDLALGSSHREDDMGAIIANKIKQHFGVEK
jgi:hypothetical protein